MKSLEIRLLISEDDIAEVLAVEGVEAVAAVRAVPAVEAVAAVAEEVDEDGNVTVEAVEAVEAVAGVAAVRRVEAVTAVEAVAAHIRTSINCHLGYEILDADGEVIDRRAGEFTGDLPPKLKSHPQDLLGWAFAKAKKNI